MGTGTLTNRSSGQTILDTFFNDIHGAMNGDFVGRNTSGVPTSAQNLGTTSVPWGVLRCSSIVLGGVSVSPTTSPVNRVTSGKVRSTSNQPAFITPNGAAASFILAGSATNLVFDVNGTSVTVSTDITKSSLTVAASSNNTCLVDEATAADQEATRTWGEVDAAQKYITVDTMGTSITALVGKFAAFKINDGSNDEYFMAFVESSTKLSRCYRGFFYNSSLAPVNRIKFANNDTITLLNTGYVFVENNGTTVDVSYTVPVYNFTAPASPATGDYWYDLTNSVWKRYDGATFQIISRTYVGMVIMDATNCIGARCQDFYKDYSSELAMELEVQTTAILRANGQRSVAHVAGNRFEFLFTQPTWNITSQLATSADMYNATEQASTLYYAYVKDTGDTVLSDISPYYRKDLQGYYHPHNPWRCVGAGSNSSGSDFTYSQAANPPLAPTVVKITATGSGTYSLPKPRTPLYIKVKIVGAGGGGAASAVSAVGGGSAGTASTWGSICTAQGGGGGDAYTSGSGGGTGGSATIVAPAVGTAMAGGYGQGGGLMTAGSTGNLMGGNGASTPLGGAGGGGAQANTGRDAKANTGSGGGGGGGYGTVNAMTGNGGGAGAYCEFIIPITDPTVTYGYQVGTKGAKGTNGAGIAGGDGADGYIEVTEYYQ